ncbi:MAG: hypothetical protein ACFFHV_19990 [Promethearchaeota archaeon]
MAVQKVLSEVANSFCYSNDFIKEFGENHNLNIIKGSSFDFTLIKENKKKKLNPILKLAKPQDSKAITDLVKEVYDGSYPYKEMEDEQEVCKMIESGEAIFILFMNEKRQIIGSTCFVLDFKAKRGNMRTWVVKKEYHGNFESTKSLIGCCLCIWPKYKNQIFMWYGEVRTAHAKTQYILNLCTLKPVGFYPNKDVFFDKIESDILQVSYDKRALHKYRCKKKPNILPVIKDLFLFMDQRYNLGAYTIFNPNIELDQNKLKKLQGQLIEETCIDKFGYVTIILSFKNSSSYLEFLYTPTVQNFEKTKYYIKSLEELFVLVQEFIRYAQQLDVRYYEVFVSAYNPSHQKIFLDLGLTPRGYVPSWEYNSQINCFEDRILFNFCNGPVDGKITVYVENKALLDILGVTMY